jgi:hypothetical protein
MRDYLHEETGMKLRIKGNSLRIRVTQGELAQFAATGRVTERVDFGGGAVLTYALVRDPGISALRSTFSAATIEIRVPEPAARQWCRTEEVTLSATYPTSAGDLRLMVEKDFGCLAIREGEDESDNFPNPNQTC